MKLFHKKLTKTDIGKRLCIPTNCLRYLPGFEGTHGVNLPVKDKWGLLWEVHCSIRKKGYTKPVFTAGWIKFVRHYKLRIGDEIIFHGEKDKATGLQYKIEVKKKINLLGKPVWAGM